MIDAHVLTDIRIHACWEAAGRFNLAALAGEAIHVGGRATQIRDHAGESGHTVAHCFDLADHRILGAALDDAALVFGNGTEGAAAEATALYRDRETDHLVGRNFRLAVGRGRHTLVWQLIVWGHLFRGER